jgi:hypothetical protein
MTPWLQSLSGEFGQNAKIRIEIDNSERTITLSVTLQLPGRRVGTQQIATFEEMESLNDVFAAMVQNIKIELGHY